MSSWIRQIYMNTKKCHQQHKSCHFRFSCRFQLGYIQCNIQTVFSFSKYSKSTAFKKNYFQLIDLLLIKNNPLVSSALQLTFFKTKEHFPACKIPRRLEILTTSNNPLLAPLNNFLKNKDNF